MPATRADDMNNWPDDETSTDTVLEIPWRSLSVDALRGVLEEYATREGTEYGISDVPLATKVAQLQRQLERGEVLVFFDTALATCQLLTREQAQRQQRAAAP